MKLLSNIHIIIVVYVSQVFVILAMPLSIGFKPAIQNNILLGESGRTLTINLQNKNANPGLQDNKANFPVTKTLTTFTHPSLQSNDLDATDSLWTEGGGLRAARDMDDQAKNILVDGLAAE